MACKVGTFSKTTDAASVQQAISGVGFKPRAVMLWTSCCVTSGTLVDSARFAFGYAARNSSDTITQGACGWSSEDNVANTNCSRRAAQKALSIIQYDESLLAECDLYSFDSDGFTLNWTTNNGTAYLIHWMALGGESITDAYVKNWTLNTSTGNQAVSGVGFQPDIVFHLMSGQAGTLPLSNTHAGFSLGAMTSAAQCVAAGFSRDAYQQDRHVTNTRTSYCMWLSGTLETLDGYASYVSLDADGFTVNVNDAPSGAWNVFSLCLAGGNYRLSSFANWNGVAGNQSYTGAGFKPDGVLLWSNAKAFNTGTGPSSGAAHHIGATDGTNQAVANGMDDYGSDPTDACSIAKTDRVLCLDYLPANGVGSIDTEASIVSLDADGFTLNWNDPGQGDTLWFAFYGGAAASGLPFKLLQGQNLDFRRSAPGLRGVR